jgi:hypothetical protein
MQSRSEFCVRSPPARPPVADMIATGLSRHGLPFVRLTQSSAFFSTPDRALLYSGPAMITASAEAIWSASSCTSAGMPCPVLQIAVIKRQAQVRVVELRRIEEAFRLQHQLAIERPFPQRTAYPEKPSAGHHPCLLTQPFPRT